MSGSDMLAFYFLNSQSDRKTSMSDLFVSNDEGLYIEPDSSGITTLLN